MGPLSPDDIEEHEDKNSSQKSSLLRDEDEEVVDEDADEMGSSWS